MGPLRRGLIALMVLGPSPAWASACAQARPNWVPGTEVTAVAEAIALISSPFALVMILASAICIRFRSQWGTLVVVVLWSILVSILAFTDFGGRGAAIAEGCIGSPSIFIAIVAALSVAMILYTSPRADRGQQK